ncbi:MAG: hypothetical protein A4E53_04024 [Pelotomaculum sp. PtaB.Bin104]|nr:MAG: hypothetical protein A4E53_04024 [Pelotomaculum sp. PtaB.Bin104]
MLNENTVSKLQEMRLSVMVQAFREQMKDGGFTGMSFEERFGLLVDAEWAARKSNRMIAHQKCGLCHQHRLCRGH